MDVWGRPESADWRNLNLANWESRVPLHIGPDGYDRGSFDDPGFLSAGVRYDLPKLGRLDGLDIVHLQCHIGTDTVSLSRLGPRSTVGLDFSPAALRAARELAVRARADIAFIEADVHGAVQALGADRFDLVYTGIGALCWIPRIGRWADVVAGLLRPGGRLFMREYHPVLWTLSDPRPDGLLVVEYPYFETDGTLFIEHDTYAGTGAVASPRIIHFNHGLGEIFTALTDAGLTVTTLEEHREAPWALLLFDELREKLLAGGYPPGSRISIEDVKDQFGVSKQPVMEAMRRLESIGIVEIVPQSGCRVIRYSAQEIRDFFNLFGRFEGEIAAAAATRRSEAQLVDLHNAWQRIADLEKLADHQQRSRQYRFLNREYHLVIHEMANSRVMANLSERMWDLSDFLVTAVGGVRKLSDSIGHRNHDHDVIRTAIVSQNPRVARAAMESHIIGTVAAFAATVDSAVL